MQDTYRYRALRTKIEIRTLTLFPGVPGQPLVGELAAEDIESIGPYEALSYVWGDPERKHCMICNEKQLHLTKSLYEALQRIRLPDRPRRLWADQACINQDDVDERGAQVQLMNKIYQNANHVLVWLGNESREGVAQATFETAMRINNLLTNEPSEAWDQWLRNAPTTIWDPLRDMTLLPWVSTSNFGFDS
jgi:hypothetical protein